MTAYGSESNDIKNSQQSYASTINERSNMPFAFRKTQSLNQPLPIGKSKH